MPARIGLALAFVLIVAALIFAGSIYIQDERATRKAEPVIIPDLRHVHTGPSVLVRRPRPPQMLGLRSNRFPETNGLHWFLLAAEVFPHELSPMWASPNMHEGWEDDILIREAIKFFHASFGAVRKGVEVGNVHFLPPGENMSYLGEWREIGRAMIMKALVDRYYGDIDSALSGFAFVFGFAAESSRTGPVRAHLFSYDLQFDAAIELVNLLQSGEICAEQCLCMAEDIYAIHAGAPRLSEALRFDADIYLKQRRYNSQSSNDKEVADTINQLLALTEVPIYRFDSARFASLLRDRSLGPFDASTGSLLEAEARAGVARAAVVTVAALESYCRKKGTYPDSLTALVPSILPELPNDPYSGQPLRYILYDGKYTLYSIGKNMKDEYGDGIPWEFAVWPDYVVAADTAAATSLSCSPSAN